MKKMLLFLLISSLSSLSIAQIQPDDNYPIPRFNKEGNQVLNHDGIHSHIIIPIGTKDPKITVVSRLDSILYIDRMSDVWHYYFYNRKGFIRKIYFINSQGIETNSGYYKYGYTPFDSLYSVSQAQAYIPKRDYHLIDSLAVVKISRIYHYNSSNYIELISHHSGASSTNSLYTYDSLNRLIYYRFKTPNIDDFVLKWYYDQLSRDTMVSQWETFSNVPGIQYSQKTFKQHDSLHQCNNKQVYRLNIYDSTIVNLYQTFNYTHDTFGNISSEYSHEYNSPGWDNYNIHHAYYRDKNLLDSSFQTSGVNAVPNSHVKRIHYYGQYADQADSIIDYYLDGNNMWRVYGAKIYQYNVLGDLKYRDIYHLIGGALTRVEHSRRYYTFLTLTSISEEENIKEKAQIAVFPNPASDYIDIRLPHAQAPHNSSFELQVFNLHGKMISSRFFNGSDSYRLNISHIESGIYLFKILERGIIISRGKFVKM